MRGLPAVTIIGPTCFITLGGKRKFVGVIITFSVDTLLLVDAQEIHWNDVTDDSKPGVGSEETVSFCPPKTESSKLGDSYKL